MEKKSETTKKRTLQGTVVSTKGDKTAVVSVDRFVKHPKYGKFYKISKKYHAHDEANECNEGESVTIEETKPFSKKKTFKIVK